MRTPRLALAAAAALLALGGCGGGAPAAGERGGSEAPADTGTLAVGQAGTAASQTIWYVRIETSKARPVFEVSSQASASH